jgi:hypothetical protein
MREFWRQFEFKKEILVLDVGGDLFNWLLHSKHPELVILNLSKPSRRVRRARWVVGDGRYLPFKDGVFDIVYSNSVIEHLGNLENQYLFSSECRRVANRYYVQTPDKRFPIEPHFITPFIHWLPSNIQKVLLRNFTVWGLLTRPTESYCNMVLREIKLLKESEMKMLFPDAKIINERFFLFSKSLIAIKTSINNKITS